MIPHGTGPPDRRTETREKSLRSIKFPIPKGSGISSSAFVIGPILGARCPVQADLGTACPDPLGSGVSRNALRRVSTLVVLRATRLTLAQPDTTRYGNEPGVPPEEDPRDRELPHQRISRTCCSVQIVGSRISRQSSHRSSVWDSCLLFFEISH